MTIEFTELEVDVIVGEQTQGILRLSGQALALAATNATAYHDVSFFLEGESEGDLADSEEDIEIPTQHDETFFLGGESLGSVHLTSEADSTLYLGGEAGVAGMMDSTFLLFGQALSPAVADDLSYAIVVEQDAYVVSYGGLVYEDYEDSVIASDELTLNIVLILQAMAQASDTPTWVQHLLFELESNANALELFKLVIDVPLVDIVNAVDTGTTFDPRQIITLADMAVASGEITGFLNAVITIVAAAQASDFLSLGQDMSVESVAALVDSIDTQLRAVLEFIDNGVAADELTSPVAMVLLLENTSATSDDMTWSASQFFELFSNANAVIQMRFPGLDGGDFVAYAMNLRNAGVTKYENYPFYDFAIVGDLVLGAGPDGIYSVYDGDDDEGEPIHARVRTGLSDFGTQMLKHLLNGYLGVTADGQLIMKVITTDKGRKKENWYALAPRHTTTPTDNRFPAAKGLTSLYYGFEVENIDGAYFELDKLTVWPFAIQRRKSGR